MPRLSPLLAALLWLTAAVPAAAVDIVVTVLGDGVDADPNDGICDADLTTPNVPDPAHPGQQLGQCTLRAALQIANATPGHNRILLRSGTTTLGTIGAGEDSAASGDLDVTGDVEILGRGYRNSFIDGKRVRDRIFDVRPGGKLRLTSVSLMNGRAPNATLDSGDGAGGGGCIRSAGETKIDATFFFRCSAGGDGGAVSVVDGTTTITDSIFAENKAKGEGGSVAVGALGTAVLERVTAGAGGAGSGGAIAARGLLALTNGTITANTAKLGGGVAVLGDGTATIQGSTLASNRTSNLGLQTTGAVTIWNSIVSGGKTDCIGTPTSAGGNLESAASCGFTGTNDQQNADPLLSRLAFNGSVIPTMAIASGSPAVDHGIDGVSACGPGDARGRLPFDEPQLGPAIIDAGAFEVDGVFGSLSIGSKPVDTATVGVKYSYDVDATSSGRATCPIAYSLLIFPDGMTIDPDSGLIEWTPTAAGDFDVSVIAEDATISVIAREQDFTIHVAPAP